MTVSTKNISQEFHGNDVATEFGFQFPFFTKDEIEVYLIDKDNKETKLAFGTDYDIPGRRFPRGATVKLLKGPLASDNKLFVIRVIDYTQLTAFRNMGAYKAEAHENALDKLTMLVQQNVFNHGNSIQLNVPGDEWQARGIPFDSIKSNSSIEGKTGSLKSLSVTDSSTIKSLSSESASIKSLASDLDASWNRITHLPPPSDDEEPMRKGDAIKSGAGPTFKYVDDKSAQLSNEVNSQVAGKTWPITPNEEAKDGDDLTGYDNVRLMLNSVLTLFPIKKKDGSRTPLIGNLTNINTTTKPYSATVGTDDVWLLDKRFYGSPVMGVTPELIWCEGHSADSLRDPSVTLIDNLVTLQAAADFARNSNLSLNLSDVFYYTSGTVYFGDLKVRADVAGWTDPYYARRPDGTNFIDGSNSANWNYFYNADDAGRNTTWRKHLESARYGAAIMSDTASPIISCNPGEKFNSNGFGIIGNHRLKGQDGLAYPLTQQYDGNAHDVNFLRGSGCGNHGVALYNGYETSVTRGLKFNACNGNGFFAGVVNGGAIDSATEYLRFKDCSADHCRLGGFYFEHVRKDIVFDNVNGNNSGQYDSSSVKVDPLLGYDRTIPTTRKDMKSLIWINDACLDSVGDQGAMLNIEFKQVWGEQIAVLVHVRSQFMSGIARNIRFNNLQATRVSALAGKAKDDPSNGVAIFLDIKYLEDMKVANVYEQALAMIDVENVTAATESIDIFGYTPITEKEFAILRNRYGGFSKDERHASRVPAQFKDFPAQPADHTVTTDVIKGAHTYIPAPNEMPHAAKWRLTGAHGVTDTDRWAIYEITVMRTNLGKYQSSVHEIVNTGSFTAAPTLDYDTGDLSVPMREYSLLSVELLDPYEWIGSGF